MPSATDPNARALGERRPVSAVTLGDRVVEGVGSAGEAGRSGRTAGSDRETCPGVRANGGREARERARRLPVSAFRARKGGV